MLRRAVGVAAVIRGLLIACCLPSASAQTQTERALQVQKLHRDESRAYDAFEQAWNAGKVEEAYALSRKLEAVERELIAATEKAFPENKVLPAMFRDSLGRTLGWQADRDEDRDALERALAARGEAVTLALAAHGEGSWQAADARRLKQRTEHARTLAAADRKALAEARALNREVLRLNGQGKWSQSLPLAVRALETRERILGPRDYDCAVSLANLAGIYDELADYARALPRSRRALEIERTVLGESHPEYARAMNNLAVIYHHRGDYHEAEPCYRQALEINRRLLGPAHPECAANLTNLAALQRDLGKPGLAEPLAREAAEISRKALGENDPTYVASLNNLAAIYQAAEEYAKAEPLYRQVLELRRKNLGAEHPGTAWSLNNLAALAVDQGDLDRALELFGQSRDAWRAVAGTSHPEYARSLHNLAGCYALKGDHARSEPLYREALATRRATLGDRHPLTAATEEQLALDHAALGRWDEATGEEDRARRALRWHIRRILPALTARDQLSFLQFTDQASLNTALSLGLARRDDPRLVERSAAWVLNGKGVIPEALAEQSLLARAQDDPALVASVHQVQEARALLAIAVAAGPGADPASSRRLVERLEERERDLSAKLRRAGGSGPEADPWVEVDTVRRALPAGSILVEVARVAVYDVGANDPGSRWRAPHYAAWLIPPHGAGSVRLIDLGEAEPIDRAVIAFRKAMEGAGDAVYKQGEPKAEAAVKKTLDAVARLVLRPMEQTLAPARRWFLSPDASLWLVPWGALPLAGGKYAVEEHTVSDLVSGRDLAAPAGLEAKPRTGLVVADPDFDLAATPLGTGAGAVASRGRRGDDASVAIPTTWEALPGTADEAAAIVPQLDGYLGAAPRVFERADAVERTVKSADRPRVVLLCTHGFFLPDQDAGKPTAAAAIDNPLLRCGLALAGANQRERALDPNGDDGILTGLEVLSADLRGTELVVLSACETGLGDLRNGQGVAGLRQAFHLAGARAVMASLWKVPDEETVDLMKRFWENLAAGRSRVDALNDAQRAVIRDRREAGQAAHPLYWAAFTLSGRVDSPPSPPGK